MFIQSLTPDEQRAFFGLAKHLIAVDGRIVEAETRALQQIELETGLSSDDIAPAGPSDEAAIAALRGNRARAAAVLELLGIAYVDSEYHPSENAMIREVAKGLGVEDSVLTRMESWVMRQMDLAREAEAFFGEGD